MIENLLTAFSFVARSAHWDTSWPSDGSLEVSRQRVHSYTAPIVHCMEDGIALPGIGISIGALMVDLGTALNSAKVVRYCGAATITAP